MYLAHVAHSLQLEIDDYLSWNLASYEKEDLELIFDGKNFINYEHSKDLYIFGASNNGGRMGITDWNPLISYNFLVEKNMLGSGQLETVYNLTQWMRENLVHENTSTPENWDGYKGFPPLETILNPPEGERHWINGCWASTSLYAAILQAVNIPVRHNYSIFANSVDRRQGMHSRTEFLNLKIGLGHSDDPYSLYFRRGVNEIPVERLFLTLEELDTLIDNPEIEPSKDYKPSRGEQASYNMRRRELDLAFEFRADTLLLVRAHELLGRGQKTLEDVLTGKSCGNNEQCFWKQLYSAEERNYMTSAIDQTLLDLGKGDLIEGCHRLIERRHDYRVP